MQKKRQTGKRDSICLSPDNTIKMPHIVKCSVPTAEGNAHECSKLKSIYILSSLVNVQLYTIHILEASTRKFIHAIKLEKSNK